jgi:hypothetical protein
MCFGQDSQEGLVDDKERFMRQVETKRELYRSITCEEKRKEEVLKVFEGLGELAERRAEVPHSPPWEPCHW